MNFQQLPAPVRRHINANQLPECLTLRTKRQLQLMAYRLILMVLVPLSAVSSWFEQSLFYAGLSLLLFLTLIVLFMLSFQLVLDKTSNQASVCTRFATRLVSQSLIQPLSELSILVHQIPGLAGQYQITLANQRYTIGSLTDAEQGAAYLAGFCGCNYQVKASEFSAMQTAAADSAASDDVDQLDIHNGRARYFWQGTALLKLFAFPFMLFSVIGLLLKGFPSGF